MRLDKTVKQENKMEQQIKKKINLAIVGATGLVGATLLEILAERNFPINNLYLLASEKSAGEIIDFYGKSYIVENVADFDFSKANIAIFSAGSDVAAEYAPIAAKKKCIVIDNSSQFRYDDDVPLVVPEINGHLLKKKLPRNIIANPNCSTAQMVVALKPIYDAVGIHRINVATYQSVSGHGKEALEELARQTANLLGGKPYPSKVFPKQIAFNILPQIDVFEDNGYTFEEMKMVRETQKIFADSSILVNPTAVRVPVFYGHAMAVHIETKKKITATKARQLLKKAAGVAVVDQRKPGGYPTQVTDASGKDAVFVGRIREDVSCELGLNLWVVADNLRKGAALNAIQIAECLLED